MTKNIVDLRSWTWAVESLFENGTTRLEVFDCRENAHSRLLRNRSNPRIVQTRAIRVHIRTDGAKDQKLLGLSIDKLHLSARQIHCLRASNIERIGDVLKLTRAQLLRIPNMGHRSLDEIERSLAARGLTLR